MHLELPSLAHDAVYSRLFSLTSRMYPQRTMCLIYTQKSKSPTLMRNFSCKLKVKVIVAYVAMKQSLRLPLQKDRPKIIRRMKRVQRREDLER